MLSSTTMPWKPRTGLARTEVSTIHAVSSSAPCVSQ